MSEFRDESINFIKKHRNLFKDGSYEELYDLYIDLMLYYDDFILKGEPNYITYFCRKAGIDPLLKMLHMPASFDFGDKLLNVLKIPSNIREAVSFGAFQDCYNLEQVYIPLNITQIYDDAFYGCPKLFRVIVPDTLSYIASYAFADCINLKEIKIPKTCKVENGAFDPGVNIIRV